MKSLSLVVALTLKAYPAYATPVATEAVVGKPISSECINIRFQLNWLVAECLTGKDNTTRQKTAIWLHSYVWNDHGTMKVSILPLALHQPLTMTISGCPSMTKKTTISRMGVANIYAEATLTIPAGTAS